MNKYKKISVSVVGLFILVGYQNCSKSTKFTPAGVDSASVAGSDNTSIIDPVVADKTKYIPLVFFNYPVVSGGQGMNSSQASGLETKVLEDILSNTSGVEASDFSNAVRNLYHAGRLKFTREDRSQSQVSIDWPDYVSQPSDYIDAGNTLKAKILSADVTLSIGSSIQAIGFKITGGKFPITYALYRNNAPAEMRKTMFEAQNLYTVTVNDSKYQSPLYCGSPVTEFGQRTFFSSIEKNISGCKVNKTAGSDGRVFIINDFAIDGQRADARGTYQIKVTDAEGVSVMSNAVTVN